MDVGARYLIIYAKHVHTQVLAGVNPWVYRKGTRQFLVH